MYGFKIRAEAKRNNIIIGMPKVKLLHVPCDFAYTFKIDGIDE